jgi:hypothetical protein
MDGFADLDRDILPYYTEPDEVEKGPLHPLLPTCVLSSIIEEREEKESACEPLR